MQINPVIISGDSGYAFAPYLSNHICHFLGDNTISHLNGLDNLANSIIRVG
jgi:hypothetical protein